MNEIITLTRKDLQLLLRDKTSLILTFAMPLTLIALIGSAFTSAFPASMKITSYDYAFSKVMFYGIMGGAASSVASFAIEKHSGTLVRLQLAPISKLQILMGKNLACLALVLFSSVASWLFATLLFGIYTHSYFFLAVILFSNGIFFCGLMTFLSNFVSTERAAGGLSWAVLQVLACFSGIMFPIAVMPAWMVAMSKRGVCRRWSSPSGKS